MFAANTRYFPRVLGVSSPGGDNVYEFLVTWDHQFGSLARILEVFAKYRTKILQSHSQLDPSTNVVVGTFYCEATEAGDLLERLRNEMKSQSFVQSVEFVAAKQSLFDRFLFPVTVWGRQRVIIMRMDPLLNIEKRLAEELGSAGSAIMFREGESYATETIGQYKSVLGNVPTHILLDNVIDGLRATGWGLFVFKETREGYEVTVDEAPLLASTTEASRFLCGIIAGILETIFSVNMGVVETTVEPKSGRVSVKLSNAKS